MSGKVSSTWLITGASSGIGKALALEALSTGCKVIGTTRDVGRAETSFPEFSVKGGIWKELDPGHNDSFAQFSSCCREYGVDVLVNNAAYAFIGGVEDTSESEVREQMEVNFYGPIRALKACLPTMRAKKSGNIVLISSAAGFISRPARGTYSASKFAIEAIHESLAQEVQSFGIKVLIVEPGAFRTPFSSRIITPAQYASKGGLSDVYKGTVVDQMLSGTRDMMSIPDFVKGDPDKAASAIVNAVRNGHEYLRMPLGPDSVRALESKLGSLKEDLEATRSIANSTDVN
ncbi:short chain oxidoreductase protein [Pochonia chlamydosporia 170]|uniref:Short chain oxidoreductase protein n=1 Tax=Pochonia chlamydosporia 170 TaxID=1380566 RepID=A0A179F2D8_METCM|nr:short chain oxidoreductase protein [Pochonia chlamydosporia 170]OAQ59588.1 short chain oxidoreductase protein [Pochonia chlamydosporia 170]